MPWIFTQIIVKLQQTIIRWKYLLLSDIIMKLPSISITFRPIATTKACGIISDYKCTVRFHKGRWSSCPHKDTWLGYLHSLTDLLLAWTDTVCQSRKHDPPRVDRLQYLRYVCLMRDSESNLHVLGLVRSGLQDGLLLRASLISRLYVHALCMHALKIGPKWKL